MTEAALPVPDRMEEATATSIRRSWMITGVALSCALLAVGLQLYRPAPPVPPDCNGRWLPDRERLAAARTWVPSAREALLLDAARRGALVLTVEGHHYMSVLAGNAHRATCVLASRGDGLTALTLDQPDPLLGATLVFQADHGRVVLRLGGDDPLLLPLIRQDD